MERWLHYSAETARSQCYLGPWRLSIQGTLEVVYTRYLVLCSWQRPSNRNVLHYSLNYCYVCCSGTILLSIYYHVDCFVLTDGCGCLADIASASRERLIDCTLEPTSADTVVTFFGEDVIIAWVSLLAIAVCCSAFIRRCGGNCEHSIISSNSEKMTSTICYIYIDCSWIISSCQFVYITLLLFVYKHICTYNHYTVASYMKSVPIFQAHTAVTVNVQYTWCSGLRVLYIHMYTCICWMFTHPFLQCPHFEFYHSWLGQCSCFHSFCSRVASSHSHFPTVGLGTAVRGGCHLSSRRQMLILHNTHADGLYRHHQRHQVRVPLGRGVLHSWLSCNLV